LPIAALEDSILAEYHDPIQAPSYTRRRGVVGAVAGCRPRLPISRRRRGVYVAATETLRPTIEFRIDLAHHFWTDAAASHAADSFRSDDEGESGALFGEEGMTRT
jgi:hypothetical protein